MEQTDIRIFPAGAPELVLEVSGDDKCHVCNTTRIDSPATFITMVLANGKTRDYCNIYCLHESVVATLRALDISVAENAESEDKVGPEIPC